MNKEKDVKRKKRGAIILLEDLAPRKDVKGGAGKIVFGEGGDPAGRAEEDQERVVKDERVGSSETLKDLRARLSLHWGPFTPPPDGAAAEKRGSQPAVSDQPSASSAQSRKRTTQS